MKNDILHDAELFRENPIKYYLKHIGDKKIMDDLQWNDHELYNLVHRIKYIRTFQSKDSTDICPECQTDIIENEWGEEYCPKCGLVTRSSYPYTAGLKLCFPYGLKL